MNTYKFTVNISEDELNKLVDETQEFIENIDAKICYDPHDVIAWQSTKIAVKIVLSALEEQRKQDESKHKQTKRGKLGKKRK